jgi:hypothetical protein
VANHLQAEKTSQVDEGLQTPQMVASAADLTRSILYFNPDRLAHSQAAARHAELLAFAVDQESAPLLVAAAWLHDIGYAPALRDTGYHPIDGARYLQRLGWPRQSATWLPTTPGPALSPPFCSSTGNSTRIRSPRTPSPTP